MIQSDHVCDSGCLYIEGQSDWKILAPTAPGPEPGSPGGEMLAWSTDDFGRAWTRTDLTRSSDLNHNYLRRPLNAQPEFYALWCDGAIRRPSLSRLYFATREGDVYRMPEQMPSANAAPELVWKPQPKPRPDD